MKQGEQGTPVADRCRVLGIKNTANAGRPLAADDVSIYQMNTGGGSPRKTISEIRIYKLILLTDTPVALSSKTR